jgi:hypothetical protein
MSSHGPYRDSTAEGHEGDLSQHFGMTWQYRCPSGPQPHVFGAGLGHESPQPEPPLHSASSVQDLGDAEPDAGTQQSFQASHPPGDGQSVAPPAFVHVQEDPVSSGVDGK